MNTPKDLAGAMNERLSRLSFEELDTLMESLGCSAIDTNSLEYRGARTRVQMLVDAALKASAAFPWLNVVDVVPVVPSIEARNPRSPIEESKEITWRSRDGIVVEYQRLAGAKNTRGLLRIATNRAADGGKLFQVFIPGSLVTQCALVVLRQDTGGLATGGAWLSEVPAHTEAIVAIVEPNPALALDRHYLCLAMTDAASDLDWTAWELWCGSQVALGTLTQAEATGLGLKARIYRGLEAWKNQMLTDGLEHQDVDELESGGIISDESELRSRFQKHDDSTKSGKPRRE